MLKSTMTQNMILEYCQKHSEYNSSLLADLEKYTWANEDIPQMISGQLVGNFLQSIIQMIKAKRVVEVGMFTGFSALKMAEVLPDDGEIHTCELYNNHIKTAHNWFKKSDHGKKITIHAGDAVQTIEQFKIGSFDLLFVDADKLRYPEYLKKGLKLLKSGGIGVFDNMLWGGLVLNPNDEDSKAINNTNKMIKDSIKVNQLLLPIRDGIMIFQKK